jgi:Rho-binding antiterminator
MSTQLPTYFPVQCEFHDRLEAIATTRKAVRITFTDTAGVVQQRVATILDVYARRGAEYLSTGSGETIRLDQVLAADDEYPANG